jgi:hypothetical protein
MGYVDPTNCNGGFSPSIKIPFDVYLDWHTQPCFDICFLLKDSSNTLNSCYFFDPHSINCVLNEHLLQGAMRSPVFNLETTHTYNRGGTTEGSISGSLLFYQPALLLVLPAALYELAFTLLNLDTSSMEAFYIYIFFFCLRRAMFSIVQIETTAIS